MVKIPRHSTLHLWCLIFCVNLTGPWGVEIIDRTLFLDVSGWDQHLDEWRVKQMALPNVSELHQSIDGLPARRGSEKNFSFSAWLPFSWSLHKCAPDSLTQAQSRIHTINLLVLRTLDSAWNYIVSSSQSGFLVLHNHASQLRINLILSHTHIHTHTHTLPYTHIHTPYWFLRKPWLQKENSCRKERRSVAKLGISQASHMNAKSQECKTVSY